MEKIGEKFKMLSKAKKIQFVLASAVSVSLLAALPVAAWFGNQRRIIKMQKIQSPNLMIISAAHREDKMFFEINGINVDEDKRVYSADPNDNTEIAIDDAGEPVTQTVRSGNNNVKITHKDYVFCVTGDAVDTFTIQVAHTTNNPFTYQVFAAKEYTSFSALKTGEGLSVGDDVDYTKYTMNGISALSEPLSIEDAVDYEKDVALYYAIDDSCPETTNGEYVLTAKNLNTANHKAKTNDQYFNQTYAENYTKYQQDAVPLYWQATGVHAFPGKSNPNKKAFSRNFILRVSWEDGTLRNADKETDIVYLTILATS